MPCEDTTEKCGVGGPVDLRVVRVSQGLHKAIPITLIGGDVMATSGYNRLIIAFYLFVSLRVICSRCHVF